VDSLTLKADKEKQSGGDRRLGEGGRQATGMVLLGGLLLALASPPGVFPWAGLLVFPGLGFLFSGLQKRVSLLPMYAAGFLFFAWIAWSLRFVSFPGYLAIPLLGGWYFVLLALAFRAWAGHLFPRPLLFGFLWMGMEYVRGHAPGIPYPLAQVSHSLAEFPWFRSFATFGGEAGLGGVLALCAALGVSVLWGRKRLLSVLALSGLIGIFWGSWIFVEAASHSAPQARVALCQVPQPMYPDQPGFRKFQDLRQRIQALASFFQRHRKEWAGCDLLVFPESLFPFTLRLGKDEGVAQSLIQRLDPGVPLLIGAGVLGKGTLPDARFPPHYNCGLLFSPEGKILGRVTKRWLVPLGETLPGMSLLSPKARDAVLGTLAGWFGPFVPSLVPGNRPGVLRLSGRGWPEDALPFLVAICFENAFPEAFQWDGTSPDFGVVLSNEAWYRGGATLDQMLALSRIRALETRMPILRSTIDGWTAWIREDGSLGGSLPLGEEGVLVADLPLGKESGARFLLGLWLGPWLGRFGLGILLLGLFLQGVEARKGRRTRGAGA